MRPSGGERTDHLRAELEALDARRDAVRERLWRGEVRERVQAFVKESLPQGSHVLVVSRGDDALVAPDEVRAAHFPQTADGQYAGHHPADSASAIAQLEEQRRRGAQFFVVPATSGWWLEHYGEFARHMECKHTRLDASGEHFVAFALSPIADAVHQPGEFADYRTA